MQWVLVLEAGPLNKHHKENLKSGPESSRFFSRLIGGFRDNSGTRWHAWECRQRSSNWGTRQWIGQVQERHAAAVHELVPSLSSHHVLNEKGPFRSCSVFSSQSSAHTIPLISGVNRFRDAAVTETVQPLWLVNSPFTLVDFDSDLTHKLGKNSAVTSQTALRDKFKEYVNRRCHLPIFLLPPHGSGPVGYRVLRI